MKLKKLKFETDKINYTRNDSGCETASAYLGYASHCLTNCPFNNCLYSMCVSEQKRIYYQLKKKSGWHPSERTLYRHIPSYPALQQ